MLSRSQIATLNLEESRGLRAAGCSYRQIKRQLRLTTAQIGLIRRTLSREKAGGTRLARTKPDATARDLSVGHSALPAGLRRQLIAAGYRTLGALADWVGEAGRPGLEAMPGIGPHRAALVKRLLDQYGLLAGSDDLQRAVEALFPELAEPNA